MPVYTRAHLIWEDAAKQVDAEAAKCDREGEIARVGVILRSLATKLRMRGFLDVREIDETTPVVETDPDPTDPDLSSPPSRPPGTGEG